VFYLENICFPRFAVSASSLQNAFPSALLAVYFGESRKGYQVDLLPGSTHLPVGEISI
jgi:hypothetical protein